MAIDKNAIEREIKKKTTGYLNEELNSFDASIDAANARINENGEKSIETTKQSYEDVFRKNRLNQIINEEKAKERMANLGLIDSGLNRTQQTAIQLQAANADAAAVRNRQAAIDTIRSGIADAIAVNDAKKADYKRERTSYWNEKADVMIANEYNTRVAEENARIEAELKAAEAKQKEYDDMTDKLNNSSYSPEYKAGLIVSYAAKNNLDINSNEIYALNQMAGLEVNQMNQLVPKTTRLYEQTWTKTKDTNNWGKGIDYDDEVTNSDGKVYTIQELLNAGFTTQMLEQLTDLRADQDPLKFDLDKETIQNIVPLNIDNIQFAGYSGGAEVYKNKNTGQKYSKRELKKAGFSNDNFAQIKRNTTREKYKNDVYYVGTHNDGTKAFADYAGNTYLETELRYYGLSDEDINYIITKSK